MPLDAPTPDDAAIRAAQQIALWRVPATDAARSLVDAIVDLMVPYLARSRAIGVKGRGSVTQDVGGVLAGILRPGLDGRPVRAQVSPTAPLWQGSAIGQHRFWTLAKALLAAGLVGSRPGVRFAAHFDGFGGKATLLWPTAELVALAAAHGVTEATRREDWQADRETVAVPPKLAKAGLIECGSLPGIAPALGEADKERMEAMRAEVARLNAAVAKVEIRGCPGVALQRRFRHALDLGGRHYAVGGGYQVMSKTERMRITMGGEPVCEVDVSASQLTVLLGLSGRRELPEGDLYTRVHPNRAAVKAWIVQTLGAGRPARRWGRDTPPEARCVKPGVIAKAAIAAYPELADLPGFVSPSLLASLPKERHGWAAGQFIVAREAELIASAMAYCLAFGVVPLPVHDALIVPVRHRNVAERELTGAYATLGKVKPRLKVS